MEEQAINIKNEKNKRIVEALLMVSNEALSIKQLTNLLSTEEKITEKEIGNLIQELIAEYSTRGLELKELAGGYRFQICSDLSKWINKLYAERPPKYSRALLEILAIITYKQPITRAEIEAIRGVAISSNIIKILLDRKWIKTAGHKNVPGKPALYITTLQFLDYFNLKSLRDLPELEKIKIFGEKKVNEQLEIDFNTVDINSVVEDLSEDEDYEVDSKEET